MINVIFLILLFMYKFRNWSNLGLWEIDYIFGGNWLLCVKYSLIIPKLKLRLVEPDDIRLMKFLYKLRVKFCVQI